MVIQSSSSSITTFSAVITNTYGRGKCGVDYTPSCVIGIKFPIGHKWQVINTIGTFCVRVTVTRTSRYRSLCIRIHYTKDVIMVRQLRQATEGLTTRRSCTHHLTGCVCGVPSDARPICLSCACINIRRTFGIIRTSSTRIPKIRTSCRETCRIAPTRTGCRLAPLGRGSIAHQQHEQKGCNDGKYTFALHSTMVILLLFCLLYTHHTQIHSTKIHIFRILCKMFSMCRRAKCHFVTV